MIAPSDHFQPNRFSFQFLSGKFSTGSYRDSMSHTQLQPFNARANRPAVISSVPGRPSMQEPDGSGAGDKKSVCSELWHACAGPLVSLPSRGSRVVYFPQGHMEQVAASMNQGADKEMPTYDLPAQIFCRVLNLTLHADHDTDEVYAQFTLVPHLEAADTSSDFNEAKKPSLAKLATHTFCKTLTASDTSTHGGFSVPRRAAEDCFPALDYSQQRPSQELITFDLHGAEWRFKHIYRGQPRRHLLTTGWSVFVSHKKLVAGDAVLFLRGPSGELRLGIRRSARQQSSAPMSVLPSHSMHMGILAAAAHAVATKSMFTVFYNPRTSPAEFVIPYNKYRKSLSCTLSVGMRFKMRFESDDATERRYMGTITGVDDIDNVRWPGSKWRSLKVGWDEHTNNERQDRVSPWDIEPFIAAPTLDFPAGPRMKRLRPNFSSLDLSTTGMSVNSLESLKSLRLQKVLQGQEVLSLNKSLQGEVVKRVTKPQGWELKPEDAASEQLGRLRGTEADIRSQCGRTEFNSSIDMFSSHHADHLGKLNSSDMFSAFVPETCQQQSKFYLQQQRQHGNMQAFQSGTGIQITAPRPLKILSFMEPQKMTDTDSSFPLSPLPSTQENYSLQLPSFSSSSLSPLSLVGSGHKVQSNLHKPLMSPYQLDEAVSAPSMGPSLSCFPRNPQQSASIMSEIIAKPFSFDPLESSKQSSYDLPSAEGACKIFGFSLNDKPVHAHEKSGKSPIELATFEEDMLVQLASEATSNSPRSKNFRTGSFDVEKQRIVVSNIDKGASLVQLQEGERWIDTSLRNRIKVHKKGSAVGRSIDISRFSSYPELISALGLLFHMEGKLTDPKSGWQVVYTDDEGDMMLVGDDPWEEFCNIVGKIFIFTQQELQAMSPSTRSITAQSSSEEQPATMELSKCSVDRQDSSSPITVTVTGKSNTDV